MNREKLDFREQKLLKRWDKGNRIFANIIRGMDLIAVVMLIMAVYYGDGEISGTMEGKRAFNYFGRFLIFAAMGVCGKLLDAVLCAVQKRAYQFDSREMVLPERGTVTLETALHAMSIKMGVIYWDTAFGLLLGILLLLMFCLGGNIPLILMFCLILAVLLAGGYFFWSWLWKKRSFAGKLLNNTKTFIPMENTFEYAAAVERSLADGVLYYDKEMVLTRNFIIGLLETDIRFVPAAVPRAEIAQLAFFCRSPVLNRYRKYDMGILDCRLYSGQSIEFLIGQGPRMERILRVLDYYGIAWSEEETVYE